MLPFEDLMQSPASLLMQLSPAPARVVVYAYQGISDLRNLTSQTMAPATQKILKNYEPKNYEPDIVRMDIRYLPQIPRPA